MTTKFSQPDTGAAVSISALQTLADDTAALSGALSNDSASELDLLSNFAISVGTQGGARDASAQVSLLIVPEVNGLYGDVSTLKLAQNYIAKYDDGSDVTFDLDAAVTARVLTAAGVRLPASNYKVGVLNETNQAFAGTNSVYQTGNFGVEDSSA